MYAFDQILYHSKCVRPFKSNTVHHCGLKSWKTVRGQSWKVQKNWRCSSFLMLIVRSAKFFPLFWTSNFDLWQFCSPLTNTDTKYLNWKPLQNLNGIVTNYWECISPFKVCLLHAYYSDLVWVVFWLGLYIPSKTKLL